MATDHLAEFQLTVPSQYWRTVLDVIGESIECAHRHGPDRWGVRVDNSVMLKVGPHEVLQFGPWPRPCHIVVASELVNANDRANTELAFSGSSDWRGNAAQAGYYASQPGTEACDFGFAELERTYRKLRPAHFATIERAAAMRRHSSTARLHSTEFVDMVASQTGKQLPQPVYLDGIRLIQDPSRTEDGTVLNPSSRGNSGQVLHSGDRQIGPTHEWSASLSVEQYISGLRAIESKINDIQRELLICQYRAPARTVYATELARMANVHGGHPTVNAQYGRLGHLFCNATGLEPDRRRNNDPRWWAVWSRGHLTSKGYIWEMLPTVAMALERLGWITSQTDLDSGANNLEPEEHQLETESLIGAWRTGTSNPKSEDAYLRGACGEQQVNPVHNRLQNELFQRLCDRYGANAVILEEGFADVKLRIEDGTFHLFEVKSDHSPSAAIRAAIGQLLEYSFTATQRGERISSVIVAATGQLDQVDAEYVEFLRGSMTVAFHYLQLDERVAVDSYRMQQGLLYNSGLQPASA